MCETAFAALTSIKTNTGTNLSCTVTYEFGCHKKLRIDKLCFVQHKNYTVPFIFRLCYPSALVGRKNGCHRRLASDKKQIHNWRPVEQKVWETLRLNYYEILILGMNRRFQLGYSDFLNALIGNG